MAEKIKQVKANLTEEVHKALRIALAEDGTNFTNWVTEHILDYLAKRDKLPQTGPFFLKKPKAKPRKGKSA